MEGPGPSPGGTRIPSRDLVGVATFCALWCLLFLTGSPAPAYLAVPVVVVGIVVLRERPVVGTLLVISANLITVAAGVRYGSVDMIAAFAFALFSVGRMVRSLPVGIAITLAAAGSTAARPPFAPTDLLATTCVFGAMWLFGVIVRRRARSAWQAVDSLGLLAAEDPEVFTATHLARERHRLATEALHSLRTAVTRMRDLAATPDDSARTGMLIQQRGSEAVAELRALLGLLRDPDHLSPGADEIMNAVHRPNRWIAGWLVLHAVTLSATVLGILWPPQRPEVLLPLAAAYAVLTWRVVTRPPSRLGWSLLAVLVVAAGVLSLHYSHQGSGFLFVVFVTAALAGRTWGERDRIMVRALDESAVMHQRRAAMAAEAVRAERLRLARDLHDVTSHAVGVMVMHAGAAQALSTSAPERAAASLTQVHAAGDGALQEIDELLMVLDDEDAGENQTLRASLTSVLDRVRGLGVSVELLLEGEPAPETAAIIHRVVQEALTNVARHAPRSRALVEIRADDRSWLIRVSNSGSTAATKRRTGSGFGLTGMAERVQFAGGTLTSGERPGGGFRVEACLPR